MSPWTGFSLHSPSELNERLEAIEKNIYKAVGKTFNLNSTQQLSDILFGTLRLVPPDRGNKTASGHYSTPRVCWRRCAGSTRWWT